MGNSPAGRGGRWGGSPAPLGALPTGLASGTHATTPHLSATYRARSPVRRIASTVDGGSSPSGGHERSGRIEMSGSFCMNCGALRVDEARLCGTCGRPFDAGARPRLPPGSQDGARRGSGCRARLARLRCAARVPRVRAARGRRTTGATLVGRWGLIGRGVLLRPIARLSPMRVRHPRRPARARRPSWARCPSRPSRPPREPGRSGWPSGSFLLAFLDLAKPLGIRDDRFARRPQVVTCLGQRVLLLDWGSGAGHPVPVTIDVPHRCPLTREIAWYARPPAGSARADAAGGHRA